MAEKKISRTKISTKKAARKPRKRPIKREVAVKKYVVRLSAAEREQLETMIGKGKNTAKRLMKARILLKADVSDAGEAWSDSRIIEALVPHAGNSTPSRSVKRQAAFRSWST